MDIRIRRETDSDSLLLGEIPFRPEVIDSVIPTIMGWGGNIRGSDIDERIFGQFSDDGTKAFFEVIIPDE